MTTKDNLSSKDPWDELISQLKLLFPALGLAPAISLREAMGIRDFKTIGLPKADQSFSGAKKNGYVPLTDDEIHKTFFLFCSDFSSSKRAKALPKFLPEAKKMLDGIVQSQELVEKVMPRIRRELPQFVEISHEQLRGPKVVFVRKRKNTGKFDIKISYSVWELNFRCKLEGVLNLKTKLNINFKGAILSEEKIVSDIIRPWREFFSNINDPSNVKFQKVLMDAKEHQVQGKGDFSLFVLKHVQKNINLWTVDLERKVEEKKTLQQLGQAFRISEYPQSFPLARNQKRKIKLFVGPTNSGKTYLALNELTSHESGTYLAPLRLLALEGQEEITKRGKKCSLVTGEERKLDSEARFTAQTIETFDFTNPVDCVLIDEFQMIADSSRGWAWTQAAVAAGAKNIVLTGSLDALSYAKRLAQMLGDELEVVETKRFTELSLLDKPVRDLSQVEDGTAIVAFSRADVLRLKETLESKGKLVSVIYGALGPEVRKEEARRFRSGETKVLVATDAIAMGLNLPIKTVVFFESEKYNGKERVLLSSSEIKQIAGRAGRFGLHEKGFVGTYGVWFHNVVEVMRNRSSVNPPLSTFFVRPSLEHLKAISEVTKSNKLYDLLAVFKEKVALTAAQEKSGFIPADLEDEMKIAYELDKRFSDFSLRDRFVFSQTPIRVERSGGSHLTSLLSWADFHFKKMKVECPLTRFKGQATNDHSELERAEGFVALLSAYSWLHYRFPESFPELEYCAGMRDECNQFIEKTLKKKLIRKCPLCHCALGSTHPHRLCNSCFRQQRQEFDMYEEDWSR